MGWMRRVGETARDSRFPIRRDALEPSRDMRVGKDRGMPLDAEVPWLKSVKFCQSDVWKGKKNEKRCDWMGWQRRYDGGFGGHHCTRSIVFSGARLERRKTELRCEIDAV
jgi:hypothetical protein